MKIIHLHKAVQYTDAMFVEGMYKRDRKIEEALYNHCKNYFYQNYRGVFFIGDEHKDEIFHESFITLWEIIMAQKLYVQNDVLKGRDGKPLSGALTTFFMSIARLKYLVWARTNSPLIPDSDDFQEEAMRKYFIDPDSHDWWAEAMWTAIEDALSKISERCRQIITMFYLEGLPLDDILTRLTSFASKDALKTAKYKCLEKLREIANTSYHQQCSI